MMRRAGYIFFVLFIGSNASWSEASLPVGSAPEALAFSHFPSRLHTFVWRNWPIVGADRLAEVLETTPEKVRALAESMGLPEQNPIDEKDSDCIYITLLRRNWHLLPYDQMLTLLDTSAEELANSLREDDFLFIKLGNLKPKCERLVYTEPTKEDSERCSEIRSLIEKTFGEELKQPEEERFHFIKELGRADGAAAALEKAESGPRRFSPCYIYSYFALYGDPLMNPELDPYPDGLLQKLAALGVDGIWMHTVLRQLAPSEVFPEFGAGCDTRLKNLAALVQRAKKFGVGIYLYMNEPRAMPTAFYKGRESMRGVGEGDYCAMCTSSPEVRRWLSDSLEYVFRRVPDLAGVFTITGSENLTHCASHGRSANCPHCKDRKPADIVAEVNAVIERGVHRGAPDAKVIVWDWGWNDGWALDAIAQLPKSVYYMSVSEWSKPIERGGVKTAVGEYSISVVGPGPRAAKHWAAAKKAGLKTVAKMQINNTWELSAVPYIPVMDLIAEHCENLLAKDVDGLMLSWTLGGYPSPNLQLVDAFRKTPPPTRDEALNAAARSSFGDKAAPLARKAWTQLSRAFQEYPYNGGVLYRAPQQYGPSNLLYPHPTGYGATMVGIPYDDVKGWSNPYPVDVFIEQFQKVADGFIEGIRTLKQAVELTPPDKKEKAEEQLRYAEAAQIHFETVANQARFTDLRNKLLDEKSELSNEERVRARRDMTAILEREETLARRLFTSIRRDSKIGYEASNHYYYLPVDLMEKVVNCRYILERLDGLYGDAIE